MKLTIRADIVSNLKKTLLKREYSKKIRFLFGKMYRSGFTPYLNSYDYNCIKNSLFGKFHNTTIRTGIRHYTMLYDINFVNERRIMIGTVEEEIGDENTIIIFHINTFDIILIQCNRKYQVEIELMNKPCNIQQLFEPVKFLYGLFNYPIEELDVKNKKEIIYSYNSLFQCKQDNPWIVPQGQKFLNKKILGLLTRDYILMPMIKGDRYMLYISEHGSFLISKRIIYRIKLNTPKSLYNTVVLGKWYEKSFIGYDIPIISGTDIRKKSLLRRLKSLHLVSIRFPFCEMTKYYIHNLADNVNRLLVSYEGVIFAPIRANYMNDRVLLYQEVENVGINFKVKVHKKYGFTTFTLTTGINNDTFIGSDNLPYESNIPLSREDREFIGILEHNKTIEFRWESDGFMPYMHYNQVSTTKFARQAWEYINDPIDKNVLIDTLRIFKKEGLYDKN